MHHDFFIKSEILINLAHFHPNKHAFAGEITLNTAYLRIFLAKICNFLHVYDGLAKKFVVLI